MMTWKLKQPCLKSLVEKLEMPTDGSWSWRPISPSMKINILTQQESWFPQQNVQGTRKSLCWGLAHQARRQTHCWYRQDLDQDQKSLPGCINPLWHNSTSLSHPHFAQPRLEEPIRIQQIYLLLLPPLRLFWNHQLPCTVRMVPLRTQPANCSTTHSFRSSQSLHHYGGTLLKGLRDWGRVLPHCIT